METKEAYGILFKPEMIDEKRVMLVPYHIIDGIVSENGLMDRYETAYKKIRLSDKISDYDTMYGFEILDEELSEYYKASGYPESHYDYPDVCAKSYLNFAKNYIFLLEKSNFIEDALCYAINIKTKEVEAIDITTNLVAQLSHSNKKEHTLNENVELSTKNQLLTQVSLINPRVLLDKVTRRVVGQKDAASELIGTICKNLKYGNYAGMKSNILLYGPSGCGKTELVRSLARELDIPLVIEDMTSYTASGYVGDSVKAILRRLFISSDNNMEKAEKGIIVLDEIDKLASTDARENVNKTDVQEELLKMIEGAKININDSNRTNQQLIMDTSNITFILCGAFTKLREQLKPRRILGFSDNVEDESPKIEVDNNSFVQYGLMTELVGRVPVKIPIKSLEVEDLEEILSHSSISSLKIYEAALLQEDHVKVVYANKPSFVKAVAKKAHELGTGARGLKTVIDETFLQATSEIGSSLPSKRILFVSKETIDDPKVYTLRKVKKGNYELSERVRESNQ